VKLTVRTILLCALCLVIGNSTLWAQVSIEADTLPKPMEQVHVHSVRKATLMSTALPGLGQAYNRKYWKIPVVYAGLATCGYFIRDNARNHRFYRDNLIAELDNNPATINTTGATAIQLRPVVDQYRRWLDLSVISLAVVYALNIIDAHVDAHLFDFDVSDDLTFQIHPTALPTDRVNAGVRLVINF
jgi:hypothetical protein